MPSTITEQPLVSHTLVAAGTAIAVVIGEELLAAHEKGSQTWLVILGVGILIMLSVWISVYVFSKTVGPVLSRQMEGITQDLSGELRQLEKVTLGIQRNLILIDETERIERNSKRICVVTSDFYWDLQPEYGDLIKSNIVERNAAYHYFCPDTYLSQEAILKLTRRLPANHSVSVTYIPEQEMGMGFFEYVIYDMDDLGKEKGIISDIFGKRYSEPDKSIDLVMDQSHVIKKFKQLVQEWSQSYRTEKRFGALQI
jgi:hypothetical protein